MADKDDAQYWIKALNLGRYYCSYIKVKGCLSVCVYQKISLTTKLLGFSFAVKPFEGPGKVYNYFRVCL